MKFAILGCGHIATKMAAAVKTLEKQGMGVDCYAVASRNLEKATDESLKIFGDENASGIVFLKSFEEYYETGYKDEKGNYHEPYVASIERLLKEFPVSKIPSIVDEEEKKRFILLWLKK
jgi:predicted dehydrogenase